MADLIRKAAAKICWGRVMIAVYILLGWATVIAWFWGYHCLIEEVSK